MPSARTVRLVGALSVVGAVVGAVVGVLVLAAATSWGGAPWWAVLLLAGSVALSEAAVVHLHLRRQQGIVSLLEARLFAELARGQERETGRSGDAFAQDVVPAAARLLGGADVELVLLAADGPVRYVGDETGVSDRTRVGSEVFDEAWVLRALGERGVSGGRANARPFLSAVLGDPDSPLAVLRARRGAEAAAFDRAELRLVEVLVGQAAAWSVAERADVAERAGDEAAGALSDLGSATAPALLVLRESADRLARLAESAGGVDDIVEELHLLERAVASLLGAIASAAAEPLPASEPEAAAHPGTTWTTTGVLR